MLHQYLSLSSIILMLCAQQARAAFDPAYICSLIANGTRIKDPRACNSWLQCDNGSVLVGTCPDEQFYDKNNNTCVPAKSIHCVSSNPCAATAGVNGFVADPYSCNGYYYCNKGTASLGMCSEGMNFNPGTQDCIRGFPCTPKTDPDSYCNIVPDGVFIKLNTSCSSYQLCWQGKLLSGSCPEYYYFNAAKGICDSTKTVECADNPSVRPSLPARGVCQHAGDFVADNSTCNGYYYCKQPAAKEALMLIWGACAANTFFNASAGGSCVPRTQIVCAYDRCAGLGGARIELANETNDDCKGYAVCQNGVKIGAGMCPAGEYFDELTQLCTQRVISYPACALSEKTTTTGSAAA